MSIWTSKRFVWGLALCLPLMMACVPPAGPGGVSSGVAPRKVSVLAGQITAAAPAGYCIDPAAVLQSGDSAIVLIGRCDGQDTRAPAILSVTVGETGSGAGVGPSAGPELAAFFTSNAGRAVLSRSGRAKTVTVLEAVGAGNAFLIRLRDTSPNRDGAGQAESWRAVLALSGRLVSLNVTGTAAAPMDSAAMRKLLDGFVAAMVAANPRR